MPVKPIDLEGAGPSSGNFEVRYHTGAGLSSAEQRTHSADTRLAVNPYLSVPAAPLGSSGWQRLITAIILFPTLVTSQSQLNHFLSHKQYRCPCSLSSYALACPADAGLRSPVRQYYLAEVAMVWTHCFTEVVCCTKGSRSRQLRLQKPSLRSLLTSPICS